MKTFDIGFRLALAAFAVIALALHVGAARAHDFYDPWCCDDRDCAPYPTDGVRVTAAGYLLADGMVVPYAEARPSPDGRFHRCVLAGQHRCFYAPPNGF